MGVIPQSSSSGGLSNLNVSMGPQWAADHCGSTHYYPYIVGTSVAVFWGFVSLIPVYNKYFFDKSQYPYPIASAGIQLGLVSMLCAVLSLVKHFVSDRRDGSDQQDDCCCSGNSASGDGVESQRSASTASSSTTIRHSWLFGPGFLYKVTWTAPIGILFGLKYGVTNLGLALLPAPTHLLLQSTDLIWTCLAAWFIKDERLSRVGYACIGACVVGSFITSYSAIQNMNHQHHHSQNNGVIIPTRLSDWSWWGAILINLSSPILLGLCITTLRVACKRLMIPSNPHLGGTTMDSFELTCWKLSMSSAVALGLACLMEGQSTYVNGDGVTVIYAMDWLSAFANLIPATRYGVMGGSLLIMVFQVNCTFLCYITNAYAVGLVGQLKIIPQWVTAALIAPVHSFQLNKGNVVGALVTMGAAAVFAVHNHWNSERELQEANARPAEEGGSVDEERLLLLSGVAEESTTVLYDSTMGATTLKKNQRR